MAIGSAIRCALRLASGGLGPATHTCFIVLETPRQADRGAGLRHVLLPLRTMQLTIQNAFALAARHDAAGRAADAHAIYEQILASLPEHPGALLKIAEQEFGRGKRESARKRLEQALASARQQSLPIHEICLVLGRVHLARGDRGAAASAIDEALETPPENAALLAQLGAVALHAG